MLQPVLRERFRLTYHRDSRQLPVYYLSVAKGGLKLKATTPGSCIPWDHKSPPPPPRPDKPPSCDYILYPGTPDRRGLGIDGTGVPMASFAMHLTELLGRPVIDRTGFTGTTDLHLRFARDSSLAAWIAGSDDPGQTADLPNIFTVIRGLGLNVVSGKGPVDVFVIDSAQRPSEN